MATRPKTCENCEIEYRPARRDQKYCGTACRATAYRARRQTAAATDVATIPALAVPAPSPVTAPAGVTNATRGMPPEARRTVVGLIVVALLALAIIGYMVYSFLPLD